MFGFTPIGAFEPPAKPDGTPRVIPPPTDVRFPQCTPQTEESSASARAKLPIVDLLQSIHRIADIKLSHFEALGLHVVSDATPSQILPDASFLPPIEEWNAIPADDLLEANEGTRKRLINGNLSPGVQTYRERQKELLVDNTAAFRTIRRIPAPAGETPARLGNAYEFFKNLELFSAYWVDTSLPQESSPEAPSDASLDKEADNKPHHLKTHVRTGTGSQLPPDYRQNLLSAFVKLVAYDFGCNVSFPRSEPRLHLYPPPSSTPSKSKPPSHFNSSATFIFRTPTDRPSARSGIVEGPVAALSARASTGFTKEEEEHLDLAREIVAILLTAQHRARDGKTERRFGEGKWWTTKPRWGGGPGGPIGKEGDVSSLPEKLTDTENLSSAITEGINAGLGVASSVTAEAKRAIGGISGPGPNKRSKKTAGGNGHLPMYENYRRMLPPSSTWDRKARYSAIGKITSSTDQSNEAGETYDDIFLLSCLNHHISIIRARVPDKLLGVLGGEANQEGWDRMVVRRSKWWDLFLKEERVEAMGVVWGMMSWLMRQEEKVADAADDREKEGESMDLS